MRLRYTCEAFEDVRTRVIKIVRMMFYRRENEWDECAKSGITVQLLKKTDESNLNNYTCQQKKILFFFKTRSNFLYVMERNVFLNTMLPSNFPKIKHFSRDYMLKSPKMHNSTVTLFFKLARKKIVFIK